MRSKKQNRALLGALAIAASSAALCLGATNVEAAEWHTNWGTTPVFAPPLGGGGPDVAYGSCEYSLPAGESAPAAEVGVHYDHTWLTLTNWRTNPLGYSPEAMSYYLCTGNQGTSTWLASPFFPLWRYMRPDSRFPPPSYSVDSGLIPPGVLLPEHAPGEFVCPSDHPRVVGAFCQTRAWW